MTIQDQRTGNETELIHSSKRVKVIQPRSFSMAYHYNLSMAIRINHGVDLVFSFISLNLPSVDHGIRTIEKLQDCDT